MWHIPFPCNFLNSPQALQRSFSIQGLIMLYALLGFLNNCLLPFSAKNLFGNNFGTSHFAISPILHRYYNGVSQNKAQLCFMLLVFCWIIFYFLFSPEIFFVTIVAHPILQFLRFSTRIATEFLKAGFNYALCYSWFDG